MVVLVTWGTSCHMHLEAGIQPAQLHVSFGKCYLYLWLNKVKEKAAYIGHGERLIQSNFHFVQHRDTKGQDTHKYRYLE